MAYYDISRPATYSRLHRAVGELISSVSTWRDGVDSRHRLGRLTDRELNDIGLSRGDLELTQHDDLRGA